MKRACSIFLVFQLFCYQVTAETDPSNDVEEELRIYDFIYDCLQSYTREVERQVQIEIPGIAERTPRLLAECNAISSFKSCLGVKLDSAAVADFMAALDQDMGFCNCVDYEMLQAMEFKSESEYCVKCMDQLDCLKPYKPNLYIKKMLPSLKQAVKSSTCQPFIKAAVEEREKLRRKQEKRREREEMSNPPPTYTAPITTYEMPGPMKLACDSRNHQTGLEFSCAHWLHMNYHTIRQGWKPCSKFTGSYKKPCGFYWAKCKQSGQSKNSDCCRSVHCYGKLG